MLLCIVIGNLQKDSINEARRLAKFLGKDLNDDQLKSILDFCSFENMKKSPAFDLKIPPESLATPNDALTEESPQEIKLFRKGQIGDWKNYLNQEMWKKIDEIVATKLEYKTPFKYEPTNKVI